MKLSEYLIDRIFSIICFVVAGLLLAGLLWLIEVRGIFILFVEVILLMAFSAALCWDYQRRRGYYNRLLEMLNRLDEKTLLAEIAERPRFLDGKIVSEILRQSNKYQNDQIEEMARQNREYREFLDIWVHEIKTPIASARLMVENDKNPVTLRIDDELRKIDHFVELVMYDARSSAVEKDFRVEKTTLRELVAMALKSYSKAIIQAGGRIAMEGLDIPVYADRKGCAFVIGQLIANAIKYRREDFLLNFSAKPEKNGVCLMIQDNGVGIPAADLPRVFEKGFTGENGRRFPGSTGIGLYLCKKLCRKMNMELSISSIAGSKTIVTIYFPTESLLREAGL